jgi:hypothetical protein
MSGQPPCGYYVLGREILESSARITDTPGLPRRARNWITGAPLEVPVPSPIRFVIEDEDEGELGAYYNTGAPLMSNELIETLRACGVDNLELHDAVIREEMSGIEHRTHNAVNVVGLIAMADAGKSTISSIEGLTSWVHKMTPDAAAARGALLFRLKEGPSRIVVHGSVKDAIEARKLPLLRFTALEDFTG